MFSNDMKSFIILNIYFLIVVDLFLLVSIYYVKISDIKKENKRKKQTLVIKPRVLAYIENEDRLCDVKKLMHSNFIKNVVIDIMLEYSQQNDKNISKKFNQLELDHTLITGLQRKVDLVSLRRLAFMRSETAYPILLQLAQSEDLDISYMSFFGLSLIDLTKEKKETVIKELVICDMEADRKVELLGRFELLFDEWLELLEKEETTEGKDIFLRNIMQKDEIRSQNKAGRLRKFLKDEMEVKIAAILAICSSKDERFIDELIDVYEKEERWEIRVAVAKGISNFKYERVKHILLKMTKDREWWVRYNAIKSIVSMGEEGVFTLIDLSLDDDKNISELAYYFLNSNKDVYNTVKDIRV